MADNVVEVSFDTSEPVCEAVHGLTVNPVPNFASQANIKRTVSPFLNPPVNSLSTNTVVLSLSSFLKMSFRSTVKIAPVQGRMMDADKMLREEWALKVREMSSSSRTSRKVSDHA